MDVRDRSASKRTPRVVLAAGQVVEVTQSGLWALGRAENLAVGPQPMMPRPQGLLCHLTWPHHCLVIKRDPVHRLRLLPVAGPWSEKTGEGRAPASPAGSPFLEEGPGRKQPFQ